ncbi:MAG: PEGA domain-containing protein, partial [Myxococcota bacterium]
NGDLFRENEKTLSRSRDGRYSMWLPPGSHEITVAARGYRPQTLNVTVEQLNDPVKLDVNLVPRNVA